MKRLTINRISSIISKTIYWQQKVKKVFCRSKLNKFKKNKSPKNKPLTYRK